MGDSDLDSDITIPTTWTDLRLSPGLLSTLTLSAGWVVIDTLNRW